MRRNQRLPGEEIERLLALWNQTRRPEVRDRLVEAHLYIAEIIARKFSGRGVDYDDLYQVASLALFKAIGRYDPERGIQLSSFVTPGMVGEVKNYFRDKSRTIRPPRRSTELIRLVESARQELTQQLSRSPRVDEIAVHANLTEDEVLEGLEAASMQPVSLDQQTVDEDEDLTLRQAIGTEEKGYSEFENADLLRRSMDQLTPKQQEVIQLRFFENLSQREVAQRTGVSQKLLDMADAGIDVKGVSTGRKAAGGPTKYTNLTDRMVYIQTQVVKKLAERSSCVIIGRCADYILRDRDDCLNVFIYAPEEVRIKTVCEFKGCTEEAARKLIEENDRMNHARYKQMTGTYRGDRHNRTS